MQNEFSQLSELIRTLRWRLDLTQSGAVEGTPLSRHSVGRYERGAGRPSLEYAAFLTRLVWRREPDAKRPGLERELLEELNAAIIPYYGRGRTIKSWAALCELVDRWLSEGQQEAQQQSDDDRAASGTVERSVPERSAAPWQLRAAMPNFVGRDPERERLVNALRGTDTSGPRAALACIRGLGGAGKTELAYRTAQELAGDFPDGQLLLELHGSSTPLRPEEALARVVQAFEPQQVLPQAVADLRSLYRSVLHGRRALIIADDARDAAQVRELLPPAGSALLITTRWRFALEGLSDRSNVELSGLDADEAAALLLNLCPRIGTTSVELAALCGSLPLALRIAGGRLASDRTLRVERFLAQLRDERSRLAALENEEAEQSVTAAFNLSYRALEPQARTMLAQLSVYPTSFSRDAIPGVVVLPDAAPGPILDQVLSQLHRAGLVELDAEGERVWLHDLVRAFAAAQLDDREGTKGRHAATYAWLVRRVGELARQPDTLLSALAIFDAEQAHIELGIRWASEHADEPEYAQILVDYLIGMPALGIVRCHPARVLRPLYTAGLKLGQRLQEPALEVLALNNLGAIASRLGDEAEAERFYKRAQALAKTVPDGEAFSFSLKHNLAKSFMGQGDFERARGAAEALLQASLAEQNIPTQVRALILLGTIERRSGEPELAVRYGEEALTIARNSGQRELELLVLGNLANAVAALPATSAPSEEIYQRATGYANEALAIAEQFGDTHGQIEVLTVLGNAATLHGAPMVAVERQQEALAIARAHGYEHLVATVLVNLGDAYRALRKGGLAAEAYAQSVQAYEALNDAYSLARAYWRYGDLVTQEHTFAGTNPTLEQAQRAARLWERAVELERANKLPTAQEHATTLAQLQRWIAAHSEGAEK